MRYKLRLILASAVVASMLLTGCGTASNTKNTGSASETQTTNSTTASSTQPVSQEIFAMDTYMTVTAYGDNAQKGVTDAVAEIQRLDNLLSIGKEDSEISKLNKSGSAALSDDTAVMVAKALDLYKSTGGAFDITVLPLMELWGFTTQEYYVPTEDEIQSTLQRVGADKLTWDESTKTLTLGNKQEIDLGGIAKGFTSSRIMEIFKKDGVTCGMVSLGGNVHLLGTKQDGSAWRVGIQDPNNTDDMLGVLEANDCAVITSGAYERNFEKDGVTYHHIIDPATGKPSNSGLTSVTIVSKDGTLADGLSTSLFVMGKDKAIAYWKQHADEFDTILVDKDRNVYITEGIAGNFSPDSVSAGQVHTIEK
ncbi:FAD:protein FMN transferase [Butyricicoccus sp.]|jgi:thiamine biosynthesis lipoprotein|uniref:FAD:protein FMN transferase n=1 Tax=Butyricicoccus TaxID=580596 RepID=UPI002EAE8748|nr:FAD:protein FMN transferase [Butyricicoccus sp.]